MTTRYKFKTENSDKDRIAESKRICTKYKDRVPVIVEVYDKHKDRLTLDKSKFLVPFDLTVGQFMYVIRKRIKLKEDEAIFIFINDLLAPTSQCMGSVYKEHKDKDGFLYSMISLESTFGSN